MKDSREVRRALRIADRTSLGPIIETDRLALRPFVPEDAEAVHAYRGDPEVMRFTGGPDRSIEETRRTIERRTVVVRASTGSASGPCS